MKHKYFILIFSFLVVLISCEQKTEHPGNLIDYIPKDVSVVFKISDFESLKSDVKNNSFINSFSKTSAYTFFSENTFLQAFQPRQESLLCIQSSHFLVLTKQDTSLFDAEFLKKRIVKQHTYKEFSFQEWQVDSVSIFTTIKDSVFSISSSKKLIVHNLENKTASDSEIKKLIDTSINTDFTTVFSIPTIKNKKGDSLNFASQASINVDIHPNQIKATGIVVATDSVPQLLSVFKNLIPQPNEIAKVTPIDAQNILAFTYNDIDILSKNLSKYRVKKTDTLPKDFLEGISEVGVLTFKNSKAVCLKSIDATLTEEDLTKNSNSSTIFKEIKIHDFTLPNVFTNQFSPLISKIATPYFFRLDDFFIFTETKETSKHIINNYLNNNCLYNTPFYKEISSQLSNASSILLIQLNENISSELSPLFNTSLAKEIKQITIKKHPLSVLQLSYDRNFAHLNWISKEASKTTKLSGNVSQILEVNIDTLFNNQPQFFTNHRTKGKDVVVQDVTNTLHFISANGKTLWKKKLKSAILGKIQEIDILKNGKKQLAFTTKNTFYIIDRNGKDVPPFPKKFKDPITQPLAIFDYNKKHNYRFVICQGKEIYMLDSTGKKVKGFTLKSTKTKIVLPPQHIRIKNKDYILIAEKSGKLNIISRIGKPRVNVSKTFKFSKTPIAKEGTNFVVISKNNTKHSISETGKVLSKNLKVSNSYWFSIKGSTKATLDDNLLRINGKLVELPFGIYTQPKIFNIHKKTYITSTEIQNNKVYVFTKWGDLLPNFPIFGTSTAQLSKGKNKKIQLLTTTSNKSFVIYELK